MVNSPLDIAVIYDIRQSGQRTGDACRPCPARELINTAVEVLDTHLVVLVNVPQTLVRPVIVRVDGRIGLYGFQNESGQCRSRFPSEHTGVNLSISLFRI